jgi:hypothetical protein
MDIKSNIFFHAPKELTTDAFLVWVLYFLDSEETYKEEKQQFFDSMLLKKEDCGRTVFDIDLKRQENNVDVLLTFRFEDSNKQETVLFEDKTWSMPHGEQLARYKKIYPDCYRYVYYKLAYVNSQEEKEVSHERYDIINASMMSATLEKMVGLHPLIKMYHEYITVMFVQEINSFHERIFLKHDYDVLWSADAQKYLCDAIVENMTKQSVPFLEIRNGTSYGRPWTQIDIARKENGYWEGLFWRVDIRSGKFYIRLNQYAEPLEDEVAYKMRRLEILRKEANEYVATMPVLHPDKVENRATKESEVLIFFLEDNDLDSLMELLPKISRRMIEVFKGLE